MSNFNYILVLLKNSAQKLNKNNPTNKVISQLEALNKQIQVINTTEPENPMAEGPLKPHKLTQEEFENLKVAYENLQTSVREASVPGAKSHTQQYLDELMIMVNRDLDAIHHADPANLADYKSMVEGAAHYTADIRGKNLDRIGGATSSRYPMSVPDGKGGYVDGYFTADSRMIPDVSVKEAIRHIMLPNKNNQKLISALQNLSKGSFNEIANALFGDTNFQNPTLRNKFNPEAHNSEDFINMWHEIFHDNSINISDNELKSLNSLANQIYNMGFNMVFMKGTANIADGGVIGQRNAAMSAVADYLGVPDLVARSNQISVLTDDIDGNPSYRNGIFMEKASGDAPTDLQDKCEASIKGVNFNNTAMKKAVTNLQILDFICGNVDRHRKNFFIKNEVKDGVLKFTGVVGIDNDSCFGEVSGDYDKVCMRTPAHIAFISKDMADKVQKMTKKDLQQVLAGFGLRTREIASAWERVKTLQKAITNRKISTVTDDSWKGIKLDTLSAFNTQVPKYVQGDGIATSCFNCANWLNKYYTSKQQFIDTLYTTYHNKGYENIKQHRKQYISKQDLEDAKNRVKKTAAEKSNYVGTKMADALLEIRKNNKIFYESIKIAAEKNGHQFQKGEDVKTYYTNLTKADRESLKRSAEDLYVDDAKKEAVKQYDADPQIAENFSKNNAPENAPAQQHNAENIYVKTENLTGRAARLADIENNLRDVLASLESTTKDHGMSNECQKMYNSLGDLLKCTTNLKNSEIENPEKFNAGSWRYIEKDVEKTLENTCYYISKKPVVPRHQYGKDRLDAAHELRTKLFSALQMVKDELTASAYVRDDLVKDVLKPQRENSLTEHTGRQTVQNNKSGLILG